MLEWSINETVNLVILGALVAFIGFVVVCVKRSKQHAPPVHFPHNPVPTIDKTAAMRANAEGQSVSGNIWG